MSFRETPLGFELDLPHVFLFFGKKDASTDNLKIAYPNYRWSRIRQTHSDIAVRSTGPALDAQVEADSQWTTEKNLALLISTADCVPVLLFDSKGSVAAAVHAGWRGVASRIVPKTLEQLLQNHQIVDRAVVGPHIKQLSFEVDADVRDQLIRSSKAAGVVFHRDDGKFEVDLTTIVLAQLAEFKLMRDHATVLNHDTKTDLRFHSHRRDREKSGRQMSFILLK